MASKTRDITIENNATGADKYLNDIFTMMKYMDNVTISDKATRFNSTEIRLIGQILAFRYVGRRLISTQLAQLLGITRSAVSQIVNRLEGEGILRRVPDEVDRKIAYIEVTEEMLCAYIGKNLDAFNEKDVLKLRKVYTSLKDGIVGNDYFLQKLKDGVAAPAPEQEETPPETKVKSKKKTTPQQEPEQEAVGLDDI